MNAELDVWRRRFVAAMAALMAGAMLSAAPLLQAQDARSIEAQRQSREWLALTDRGDGAGSWAAAGLKFREAITAERWSESLSAVRTPRGPVVQRAVVATRFEKSFPGAPEGDYAIVQFRTAFAKLVEGGETLVLEHEPDGVWRVVGYSVL
jgi:Protein of unknown function (DUF4019)